MHTGRCHLTRDVHLFLALVAVVTQANCALGYTVALIKCDKLSTNELLLVIRVTHFKFVFTRAAFQATFSSGARSGYRNNFDSAVLHALRVALNLNVLLLLNPSHGSLLGRACCLSANSATMPLFPGHYNTATGPRVCRALWSRQIPRYDGKVGKCDQCG